MQRLKLIKIGNSIGVILPKEIVSRFKLKKGGELFLTQTVERCVIISFDPALAEQLTVGRELMSEYRDTFHQLAK